MYEEKVIDTGSGKTIIKYVEATKEEIDANRRHAEWVLGKIIHRLMGNEPGVEYKVTLRRKTEEEKKAEAEKTTTA